MKQAILAILLFSISLVTAQKKKITQSDLVGYWKHSRIIEQSGQRIKVYARTEKGSKEIFGLIHFGSNGAYSVVYFRKPQRCGNHRYPKNRYGSFELNYDKQEVRIYNSSKAPNDIWNIIWIDANSFGRLMSQ